MKQHITVEQWCELEKKPSQILCRWGDKKGYVNGGALQLFTIGQMIEFLEEQKGHNIQIQLLDTVQPLYMFNNKSYQKGNTELCDALWEAVKEKLE